MTLINLPSVRLSLVGKRKQNKMEKEQTINYMTEQTAGNKFDNTTFNNCRVAQNYYGSPLSYTNLNDIIESKENSQEMNLSPPRLSDINDIKFQTPTKNETSRRAIDKKNPQKDDQVSLVDKYLESASSLKTTTDQIKKFLKKYISLPVDESMYERTIKLIEEAQSKGILNIHSMYSRFPHIVGFFRFVGHTDQANALEEWKNTQKKNDSEELKTNFYLDDSFYEKFNELKTSFVMSPTIVKLKTLMLVAILYSYPVGMDKILDYSCFDFQNPEKEVRRVNKEIPDLTRFLKTAHFYVEEGIHRGKSDCQLIPLEKKAAFERLRRNFGNCIVRRLMRYKRSFNWRKKKELRCLDVSDLIHFIRDLNAMRERENGG